MKMKNCYGCEERHIGCHSGCDTYKLWLEDYQKKKDAYRRHIEIDQLVTGFFIDNKCKRKARANLEWRWKFDGKEV